MQQTVALREATDADLEFLFHVYASTRLEELAPLHWDEAASAAFLNMQFHAQHTHYHTHFAGADYLVVLLDDAPVGRLYIYRTDEELRVMDIALLPAYRGAGIGSRLIADVMAEARQAHKAVRLHVEPFNRALRLYERLGFVKVGEAGLYWLMEWSPRGAPAD